MESWHAALGQETTIGPPSTVGAAPPSGPALPLVCTLPLLVPEPPPPSEPVPPPVVTLPAPALVPVADAPEGEPLVALVPAAAPELPLEAGSEPVVASGEPLATPPDGVLLEQLATKTKPAKCVMFLSLTVPSFRHRKDFPCEHPAAARPSDSWIHPFLRTSRSGRRHRDRLTGEKKRKYVSQGTPLPPTLGSRFCACPRAPTRVRAGQRAPLRPRFEVHALRYSIFQSSGRLTVGLRPTPCSFSFTLSRSR